MEQRPHVIAKIQSSFYKFMNNQKPLVHLWSFNFTSDFEGFFTHFNTVTSANNDQDAESFFYVSVDDFSVKKVKKVLPLFLDVKAVEAFSLRQMRSSVRSEAFTGNTDGNNVVRQSASAVPDNDTFFCGIERRIFF